jgi:hypothetical protein
MADGFLPMCAVASLETAEAERPEPAKPPETAAEFAEVFSAEVAEMRRMLQVGGIPVC